MYLSLQYRTTCLERPLFLVPRWRSLKAGLMLSKKILSNSKTYENKATKGNSSWRKLMKHFDTISFTRNRMNLSQSDTLTYL